MKRFRISFILLLIGWLSTVCALPEQDFPAFLSNGATYQAPFADGEQLTYVVNWKPLFSAHREYIRNSICAQS